MQRSVGGLQWIVDAWALALCGRDGDVEFDG
jgi:hypothetical protein